MAVNTDYYLGRQPIVGRRGELVGYECLFRSSPANRAAVIDDVAATAAVIKHAFLDLGIEAALGDKTGFINISEELLMSDLIELLPPHRVVLELLETTRITPDVIGRVEALRAARYRIALDDVTAYSEPLGQLLPFVDLVKIDVLNMTPETIVSVAASFRPLVKTLLAEKVETSEQFAQCRGLGFNLFQGYFFAKPTVLAGNAIQPDEMALLKLLAALAADAEIEALEAILKRLPDFTLRLMAMANAAGRRGLHSIKTLRQAIIALGMIQLRRLVKIVLFARQSDLAVSANPLLQTAILRGRLMELVADIACPAAVRRDAFMVGLLSLADALFNQPLCTILDVIQPETEWMAALLQREGKLGELITMAEAAEHADDDQLVRSLAMLGMTDLPRFTKLQIEALHWARNF